MQRQIKREFAQLQFFLNTQLGCANSANIFCIFGFAGLRAFKKCMKCYRFESKEGNILGKPDVRRKSGLESALFY